VIRVSAVRFFHVVSPVPRYLRAALAAAVVLGGWMLWLNPREVDSALGSVLLLQMCAASNGYGAAARHGWFDPLLVTGRSRGAVAGANLLAAAWPGVAAWLLLALVETVVRHGAWPAALALQRLAALALVTGVSWAAGLNLPRTGAAVLWIAGLLALASTRMLLPHLAALQTPPHTLIEVVSDAIAFTACPFLLLGDTAAVRDPAVIVVVLTVSAGSTMAGIAWIVSRDVPLADLL
jgi:hypothetical protein